VPKHNAAVVILSARKNLLPICLQNFSNYHPCDYDLYVYEFGKIYNSKEKQAVKDCYKGKVEFVTINPTLPLNLKESELFYNRKYNQYVRTRFGKNRINYLHMCNFLTGEVFAREELKKYDFIMRFDDDSWFKKQMPYNLIDKYIHEESLGDIFCINSYLWGVGNQVNQNHINTREGLFEFTKNFIKNNNIQPKNKKFKEVIESNNEIEFHKLGWKSDLSVWRNGFQQKEEWINWTKSITDSGGIYKYRWGNCETHQIYAYIFHEDSVFNLNLREGDYYDGHLPQYKIITGESQ
jgi:hypothetical protein